MHHEYGSKNLIETLHSHGFCASYTEVRQFLTSSANHEIISSQNETYIPNGICPGISDGDFIQEGSDNVDINAETIDGKNTFHSIARAVFQVVNNPTFQTDLANVKIKRGQKRSLALNENTSDKI